MKNLSTIVVCGLLIVIGLMWLVASFGGEEEFALPADPFPVYEHTLRDSYTFERSEYQFTKLLTRDEEEVSVRDITTNRELVGANTYVIAGGFVNEENLPFDIVYHADYNFIQISLESEPLGDVRRAAQEYLRISLGVDARLMCELDISVRTRLAVNEVFAGQELGLSFCDGGVVLDADDVAPGSNN